MRFEEVEPGVFLGCHQALEKRHEHVLENAGIKSILNVCDVCFPQGYPQRKGLHIKFVDGDSSWNDHRMLEKAVKFIKTAPRPILVHCWSGQSRSASILACALSRDVNEFDKKVKRFREIVKSDGKFPPSFTAWVRAWKEQNHV